MRTSSNWTTMARGMAHDLNKIDEGGRPALGSGQGLHPAAAGRPPEAGSCLDDSPLPPGTAGAGLERSSALPATGGLPEPQVVLVVEECDPVPFARGEPRGADPLAEDAVVVFLRKPFTPAELLHKVHALLHALTYPAP